LGREERAYRGQQKSRQADRRGISQAVEIALFETGVSHFVSLGFVPLERRNAIRLLKSSVGMRSEKLSGMSEDSDSRRSLISFFGMEISFPVESASTTISPSSRRNNPLCTSPSFNTTSVVRNAPSTFRFGSRISSIKRSAPRFPTPSSC